MQPACALQGCRSCRTPIQPPSRPPPEIQIKHVAAQVLLGCTPICSLSPFYPAVSKPLPMLKDGMLSHPAPRPCRRILRLPSHTKHRCHACGPHLRDSNCTRLLGAGRNAAAWAWNCRGWQPAQKCAAVAAAWRQKRHSVVLADATTYSCTEAGIMQQQCRQPL